MPSDTTLSGVGLEILKLFRGLRDIKATSGDEKYAQWPTDQFLAQSDRFELWAVNLGLFTAGHGALDYRVRDAGSLRTALWRFMSDLKDSLGEVYEYCDGSLEDTGSDHDPDDYPIDLTSLDDDVARSDFRDSDIDLLLHGLKDPIDRLYKMSTIIRNPSTRFESSKALRYRKLDMESNVDFLEAVEKFEHDHVQCLLLEYQKENARKDLSSPTQPPERQSSSDHDKSAGYEDQVWEPIRSVLLQHREASATGKESFLVSRIARANIRRRQHFAYWMRHREKLTLHARSFSQEVQVPIHAAEVPTNFEIQIPQDPAGAAPAPLSVTTATQLQMAQPAVRDDRSTVSVSEYAPSTHAGGDVVEFPPPPKRKAGGKFFECPYCFTMCPEELLGRKAWKAHLIRDLRPYVCTYEDCKSPEQLYDTRLSWIQHENSCHRTVWRCPEHPDRPFLSVDEYQRHLSDGHISGSSGGEIPASFIRASESVLTAANRVCPVCSFSTDAATELHKHIALHLERFALFSLPRSVGDDDDDAGSESVNVADDSSRESGQSNAENTQDVTWEGDDDGEDGGYPSGSAAGIARRRWKQVLDRVCREQLGMDRGDRFRVARSLVSPLRETHSTAVSLMAQGRLREAEDLFAEILEVRRRALGSQHARTLTSMSELASVYEQEGLKKKAELLRQEAAQIRARLSILNPLVGAANLAVPYRNQDQLEGARDLERRLKEAEELDRQRKQAASQQRPLPSKYIALGSQVDADLLDNYQAKLFEAVKTGNRAAVELLVATDGVNPDVHDSNDRTPLSWAAGFGDAHLVRLFLSTPGVDPDSHDGRGQTPLSWAADCGHADVVQLLLESGRVDADSKDASGWTPLTWAASKGYSPVVELLLHKDGVDPDARSLSGLTPLSWAVVNGYEHVARLLLESGRVNVDYDGSKGRTLLSYAERSGNEALLELVTEYLKSPGSHEETQSDGEMDN